MKISYAILTHNEGVYIEELLMLLTNTMTAEDEIVIVDDYSTDDITRQILEKYASKIKLYYRKLNNDFAAQKNFLNSNCTGDYIFNIDADELLRPQFLLNIKPLLKENSNIDLFFVPRINTVEGLTQDHIDKWGWILNNDGYVNFPDYQMRIYKNIPGIKWVGSVHERITGHSNWAALPAEEPYCILHYKHIDRQEQQNNFYNQI